MESDTPRATRNLDCPHYQACLDRAARVDADGWDCTGCRHEFTKGVSGATDFSEYRILLWAIFKPDRYEAYNELRQQQKDKPGETVDLKAAQDVYSAGFFSGSKNSLSMQH